MTTKLTLTIEDKVIISAKKYARNKGKSLSNLVENYLKSISIKEVDKNGIMVVDVSSLPMGNKKLLGKSGISAKKLSKLNYEQYELKTEQSVIKSMIKVMKAEPEDETFPVH